MLLEACVETYEQALRAEQNGAHRIELCADLACGGLTPDPALVRRLLAELHIPIKIMIRPRAGDFVYTAAEIEQMAAEIEQFKAMGAAEIVLGALNTEGEVDLELLQFLAEKAAPLPITFHKAIDETVDPLRELDRMSAVVNVKYILSSGGQATAREGCELLRKMIERFGRRYTIVAAGKITAENLAEIHALVGGEEYHGRRIV